MNGGGGHVHLGTVILSQLLFSLQPTHSYHAVQLQVSPNVPAMPQQPASEISQCSWHLCASWGLSSQTPRNSLTRADPGTCFCEDNNWLGWSRRKLLARTCNTRPEKPLTIQDMELSLGQRTKQTKSSVPFVSWIVRLWTRHWVGTESVTVLIR